MGLFSRKPSVPDEARELIDALADLSTMWNKSPGHVVHHFFGNSKDPLTTLAHALVLLVSDETLKPEEMRALGIDARELQELVDHVTGLNPAKSIHYEVAVAKAISEYEQQIDGILLEAGVTFDAAQRTRTTLRTYASPIVS